MSDDRGPDPMPVQYARKLWTSLPLWSSNRESRSCARADARIGVWQRHTRSFAAAADGTKSEAPAMLKQTRRASPRKIFLTPGVSMAPTQCPMSKTKPDERRYALA
jgi:hypothetical protein